MAQLEAQMRAIKERSDLLDEAGGIGLWEAVMPNADPAHPQAKWTWSPEFRRLCGYRSEADYPNVMQSWSDRLHPEDIDRVFAAFTGHLADKTGNTRYDATYRLKMPDGSYRWFRATGGCRYSGDGSMARACGSLSDIHAQTVAEAAVKEEAARVASVINSVSAALKSLAEGDLTARIEDRFSEKFEVLADNFNVSIRRLEDTIAAVAANASSVHVSAGEVTKASDSLSQRTEQQAASLEETAAALDQITATVRKTADGANEARQLVSTAKKDAETSSAVVHDTVTAMNGIEQSSKQISNIIGVIDEIAFQTNLLALNAGVEAARAGDAGRGFAVVATEVRALAQRSADAAKEIKALISGSGQQVQSGVTLVAETGKALGRIVEQVAKLNELISDIAASAREQATGLDQVNTAVNQMDQMTQQNAAMVEETTAASHSLASEADALSRLVGQFRIGGQVQPQLGHAAPAAGGSATGVPATGVPATGVPGTRFAQPTPGAPSAAGRTAPKSAPRLAAVRPAASPAKATPAKLPAPVRSPAVRTPAPAAQDDDGWSEF
jgi:methyl-accepting chemotaxis protein